MNDKQFNINRIKMPHMFRKSNTDIIDNDVVIDDHLAKITRSYRVKPENKYDSTNSYVDCLKNYEQLLKVDETAALREKLALVRQTLVREIPVEEAIVEEINEEVIEEHQEMVENNALEEITPVEENGIETLTITEPEPINIDEIIKSSEQEIINAKDQKSLLKSLIDDINVNSANIQYDDSKFEQNIKEIINEAKSTEDADALEVEPEEAVKEEEPEIAPVVNKESEDIEPVSKKKANGKVFLLLLIILLLLVALYVNREAIFDLF